MKAALRFLTCLAVVLTALVVGAQTVTLTSNAEIACGIMQYSSTLPAKGLIRCINDIPVTSSNGATVSVAYLPIYNATAYPLWPGYNVLEFYGLFPQYAVGHITAFTRVDTGQKDDEGYELWRDDMTFVSIVIPSPYGDSYHGQFSGSCTAINHITPFEGGGRYGGHYYFNNESLNCIVNQ